ncbi:MAG: hypothetical protein CSA29_04545 [Desulfobacterales bacterium]|nr:MAG: hypothetical protein CSA29_04545 [Desulfobacterales bacterium]
MTGPDTPSGREKTGSEKIHNTDKESAMTAVSIKSLGSGIGGAVVLTFFAGTFLTVEKAVFIIPLFLSFTGAMIGFQVVSALGNRIRGKFIFHFVMGAGQGVAVFSIVNVIVPMFGGYLLLSAVDLLIYMIVSGVACCLGARLAVRHFNL